MIRAPLLALAALTLATGAHARRAPAPPPEADCGLEPPGAPITPPPRKPNGPRGRLGPTGHTATGALAGKTVYVSPGHGFTWTGTRWSTQRGNTNGIVEDLVSIEAIDSYLLAYLRQMGAHVVPLREADPNSNLVIVDDSAAGTEGTPSIDPTTDPGFGASTLPLTGITNPFELGSAQRMAVVQGAPTGGVVYALSVPESGYYNVYGSYAQGPDRAADAHYQVRHSGGETDLRIDQRRHGSTWVLFGRFWFDADAPLEESSVVIWNDASSGTFVSLDAVRAGGGGALIDRGGGTNGRPMFEHAARYYAQWNGAPADVYDYRDTDGDDDVVTRSRFAAWDHEDGEDAIYVAWHTNAPNPAVGTSSYTYGPSPPPGPVSEFTGTPGSLELQALIHDEIVSDLRAVWDPAWVDRGKHTAYFGEVNPAHNPEMPATLIEVAFHDTPSDADAIRDPLFRRLVTRAMAHAIARYFAQRDGLPLTLPPEPPTALRVENEAGALRVSFRPPDPDPAGGDAAQAYRVYTSRDGRGFDAGTEVSAESVLLEGLSPGQARYVRVTAVNAGGESMPTEVVGARVGLAPVLVVGGFDRLDGALLPVEDLSSHGLGMVDRMRIDRINDGTYAGRHGAAIVAAGVSFDGASDEAIDRGDVDLLRYRAIDWFLGEESSGDEPLSPEARAAIAGYLASGGRLLLTGSEIGWALDYLGTPEEQAFYRDVLHATYAADDSQTYDVLPLEGPYGGLAAFSFGDPAPGAYDPEWPDVLLPGVDAFAALEYGGGLGGHAAIAWRGAAGDRGVLFGFPFETIEGEAGRGDVMARTLAFFEIEPEVFQPDAGTGDGGAQLDEGAGGCGCRAGGSGGGVGGALLILAAALAARRRRP